MRYVPAAAVLLVACGPLSADRPHLAVEPRTLHLPGVVEGAPGARAPLSLLNLGAAPLHVTALRLSGAGFDIEGCTAPLRIEPLSECLVQVSYRLAGPPGTGLGAVVVESDDPEHPVYRVGLASPPALPALAVSPPRIDFGAVPSGTTKERQVRVHNLGRATADGIRLSWSRGPAGAGGGSDSRGSGDFAATTPATELSPGDSAEVSVTYSPTAGDADHATLELRWSGGVQRVALSGYQDLEAPD